MAESGTYAAVGGEALYQSWTLPPDRIKEVDDRCAELEANVEQLRRLMREQRAIIDQLYYAPGMPGYMGAKNASGHLSGKG